MNRIYSGFSISIHVCGLMCLGAFGVATQTKPRVIPEEKKIKVQTDLMEVRAVVTDRKGNIIENLKHEDFELLENGKQQEISFFSISKVEREQGRPDVKTKLPNGQIAELQPSTLRRLTEALRQEPWQPIDDEERVLDRKGWFDLDGDIELGAFKPGVYELRVSIKEADSSKTVQRTTVFAIE